jgi:hypothetical protein
MTNNIDINKHKITLWKNSLINEPCFIIGNGPSLKDKNISFLNDYFTIGINRAFLLIDPTVLIWQDLTVWAQEKEKIKQLKAIKYCRRTSGGYTEDFYNFKLVLSKPSRIPEDANILFGKGSTSSIAYQLAFIFGCNPIFLLGMDCKNIDGYTDFYGVNKCHSKNTLPQCLRSLSFIKRSARDRQVISFSQNEIFENKNFDEIFNVIKDLKKTTREELNSKIFKNGNL